MGSVFAQERSRAARTGTWPVRQRNHDDFADAAWLAVQISEKFYTGVVGEVLRCYFPGMPCYERFVTLQPSVLIPLLGFLCSRLGHRTGIYYIDSTALAVCHNRRIGRHKTFAGLAARGKTSMGWFFGFKLHLVFNHLNEIVAVKLTPGNVHDGAPVEQLTQHLTGKLFGDKGYLGKKRAA